MIEITYSNKETVKEMQVEAFLDVLHEFVNECVDTDECIRTIDMMLVKHGEVPYVRDWTINECSWAYTEGLSNEAKERIKSDARYVMMSLIKNNLEDESAEGEGEFCLGTFEFFEEFIKEEFALESDDPDENSMVVTYPTTPTIN